MLTTGLINVFITNRYFISWIINYLAPEMHIGLENVTTGEIVAQSQDTIIFTSPNLPHNTTYSSTMILYAGNQYRLRVLSSVVTTIYANSIFSIISI